MTATVDRAERDGLVARSRNAEDRRVVTVEITDIGREVAARVVPLVSARVSALVEGLGGPDATHTLARSITSAAAAVPAGTDDT